MRLRGVAYRAHDPRWSFEPLSGEGARLHGGRFNAPGMPALYLSLSHATAIAEANHGFSAKILPTMIMACDVDCEPVVDLVDPVAVASEGIEWQAMACDWLNHKIVGRAAPSWKIAERLVAKGIVGALVPSFLPGATSDDRNLVLWTWSDRRPSKVIVHDPDRRLPRNRSSWPDHTP